MVRVWPTSSRGLWMRNCATMGVQSVREGLMRGNEHHRHFVDSVGRKEFQEGAKLISPCVGNPAPVAPRKPPRNPSQHSNTTYVKVDR